MEIAHEKDDARDYHSRRRNAVRQHKERNCSAFLHQDLSSGLYKTRDLFPRHTDLLALAQVLERELPGVDFVFTYDQSETSAKFAGGFQRFFELEAFIANRNDNLLLPQFAGQQRSVDIHAFAQRSNVDIDNASRASAGLLQRHYQTVSAPGRP